MRRCFPLLMPMQNQAGAAIFKLLQNLSGISPHRSATATLLVRSSAVGISPRTGQFRQMFCLAMDEAIRLSKVDLVLEMPVHIGQALMTS